MMPVPELFARIYARHGHRCPMSTLGGRLGQAAMSCLGQVANPLQAVYSQRTCALDGITETTGCSEEAGTLMIQKAARHVLTLHSAHRSITVALTPWALQEAARYRTLCLRLEQDWESLDSGEQKHRRAEMDAMLDQLLPRFWHAQEHQLVQRVG